TEKHANKIRHAGDKAKLISGNDESGLTYRGRFTKSSEVASIGYDISQKAHNALKWLIQKQGNLIDNRMFLIWGNDGEDVPGMADDNYDLYSLDSLFTEHVKKEEKKIAYTHEEFAKRVAANIDGYKKDLSYKSEINILVLDSATEGRIAVLYYRNMHKELYLERLKKWHS